MESREVRSGSLWEVSGIVPGAEVFDTLARGPAWRLERIVSQGCASPEGFWYDSDDDEWVVLVRGGARIAFEERGSLELKAGDWVGLPARTRHRVEWVTEDALWLALHAGPTAP